MKKVKRCQSGNIGLGLVKRTPSHVKHKMWMRTLSSKKKFLRENTGNAGDWIVENQTNGVSKIEVSESDDSRALVVELPQRSNSPTVALFGEYSRFTNETVATPEERSSVSTSATSESDGIDDSDYSTEDDSLEETRLTVLESSADDIEPGVLDDDAEITEQCELSVAEDVENKIYVFEDKDVAIAVLQHPMEVMFCGQALVQSVSGSVSIFGCRLNSESKEPVHVYSSYKFSFLTLRTEEPERNVETKSYFKYIKYRLAHIGAKSLSNQVLSALDRNSVVVALRRAPEIGFVQYACRMASCSFGTPPSRFAFARPDFKKFGFSLVVNSACRKWVLREEQEELSNYIVKKVLHAQAFGTTAPVVVVCGGKNVGKSTFLRFLVNKVLNVCDKIFHLEGDPGQTEFTPAGCVSITQVNEPLLGPAFTHTKAPERMCYVGGITIENSPDLYSSSIQQLIRYHQNSLANHPLFVNTMGWTTGLGLSLLVDVLRCAQPTVIVQFDCGPSQSSHNLPMLNSDYLLNACGWNTSREMSGVSEAEVKVLPPPNNQLKLAEFVTAAPVLRNLAIFAYMGQLQKPYSEFQPINCFTPYSVPWSAVAVHCCHEEVPPGEVMHAVNGTLVALCHVDSSKMINSVIPNYPKCLTENPENICYGFGLVRGIDYRSKLFLVITPEKLSTLQGVNAFLIGSGKTPNQFFTTQEVDGIIPFVSETTVTSSLTSPPKNRVFRERFKQLRLNSVF